jgi:YXWGXW repeat-containing protein
MILNRSMSVHVASLALAALALTSTSCLHTQRTRHQRALAVKAEAEADLAHAQADAVRSQQLSEPEYVEAEEAPAVPAALPEQRPSAPSPGHVWVAGQHTRRGGQWVWVSGHYALPPRSDVVWVPGHWVPHLHGYAWIAGAWR